MDNIVVEQTFDVKVPENRGNDFIARDILGCVREFRGSVHIEKDGEIVSARSLLGILSLGLRNGDVIKVICSGCCEFSGSLCFVKLSGVLG